MIIFLPLLVAIIGLILFFAVKTNGDVKRVGEIMFFTGLLATMLSISSWVHVFSGVVR